MPGTNTIRTPIELLGLIEKPSEPANEAEPMPPLRLRGCRRLPGRLTASSSRVGGCRVGPIEVVDLKRTILARF